MVFSSLFFLYAFLPACLLTYALCRTLKAQNIVLLVFSLAFYAWGEPKYVLLLAFMALVDWAVARKVERIQPKFRRARRRWVILAAAVNLGLIGYFKYASFACSIFGVAPDFVKNIILPIGISFYTFQLLSYVVDVSRGDASAEREYWHVLLYASLFHQCIAGPIVRYKTISRELFVDREPWKDLPSGILRFSVGLAKKVLLANVCGEIADALLIPDAEVAVSGIAALEAVPVAGAWLGMFAYMLQIYLDFSAYSDMAIGLGRMVGLHYMENFDYPYCSSSVSEFWRRWHISLGTFFRDYVYIPLGGNRKGPGRTVLNLLVVWALTGLWHGASWNFVLWGLYFFVFLVLERFVIGGFFKKFKIPGILYTLVVVYFGWILFRYTDMRSVGAVVRSLIGANGNTANSFTVTTLFHNRAYLLGVSVLCATPLFRWAGSKLQKLCTEKHVLDTVFSVFAYGVIPVGLLLLSTAALVGSTYNPFMYFQF